MNEERGAALRLLYQIKLAVEKAREADPKSMTGIPSSKVASKWNETTKQHDTLKHNSKLETAFKSKKLQTVEKGMLRFEQKRAENMQQAILDHEAE